MKKRLLTLAVLLVSVQAVVAQNSLFGNVSFETAAPYLLRASQYEIINTFLSSRNDYDPQHEVWSALWIEVPESSAKDYGVYYFRKDIELQKIPQTYKVHLTADQRYKLYVNGTMVSVGPARSMDTQHWNYATLDLAPYLRNGKNVIAAQVWNMGKYSPISETTLHTGFLLMGEGEAKAITTNNTWKCIQDTGYTPKPVQLSGFYAVDACDLVDMNQQIPDWKDADADLSNWKDAKPFELAMPCGTSSPTGGYEDYHLLQPSILEQIEFKETRIKQVRRDGGLNIPSGFPSQPTALRIPANQSVDILLDNEVLTNAYLNLLFSKGQQASIQITYAETLYDDQNGSKKSNRNEVEGKYLLGRTDEVISNGKENQSYTTLSWRTYRYVNLHITTKDEPLVINDICGTFVGYPLKMKASLNTNRQDLQDMMEIGWRTQRLCAIETYFDCPYYEQLMYLGDTRIQALVTLFNSGDEAMVKNYLIQSDLSRDSEGMTSGRTPIGSSRQYITPYALSYIYAIHDYMMYGTDQALVEELMLGAEQILQYYHKHQQSDGRVYKLPGWNFTDWVYTDGWDMGVAERGKDGTSAVIDLQLLMAYQVMSEMELHFGNSDRAKQYDMRAEQLKKSIQESYYDEGKGMYADRIEKDHFSQHVNSWAILTGLVSGEEAKTLGNRLLSDTSLAPCSVYYKFYLHMALIKAGLGDDFLSWLGIWKENIENGLTTWAETSDLSGTRSDCHAWGSSPNIEFFRTLLGIDSAAPGFDKVRIEPHLGELEKIGGTMPHPHGAITVAYEKTSKGLKATITLPENVDGEFIYQGKSLHLKGGKNELTLR